MGKTFHKPEAMADTITHYCPGCTHGVAHRLVAEVIDELGIRDRTVGIAPVGCAVLMYNYFTFDFQESAHGRAPAMATGIKRVRPDLMVFTYQGDGDLASIGLSEIVHSANRGEKFTTIFINNAVYGMTNGQMAPTTLLNQKTLTTPQGRSEQSDGAPLRICELLSVIDGSRFIARASVTSPKNIINTKKLIEKGFKTQTQNKGFSLIEILSPCPVYWRMSSVESLKFIDEEMTKAFPLGIFKDWESQN